MKARILPKTEPVPKPKAESVEIFKVDAGKLYDAVANEPLPVGDVAVIVKKESVSILPWKEASKLIVRSKPKKKGVKA